jgi:hypothetical protein
VFASAPLRKGWPQNVTKKKTFPFFSTLPVAPKAKNLDPQTAHPTPKTLEAKQSKHSDIKTFGEGAVQNSDSKSQEQSSPAVSVRSQDCPEFALIWSKSCPNCATLDKVL